MPPADNQRGSRASQTTVSETRASETRASETTASDKAAGQPASPNEHKKTVEVSPEEAEDDVLLRVEPDYPQTARQRHIQGTVVLSVRINEEGKVEDASLVSGPQQLLQPCVAALMQWRFKPKVVDGQPAAMMTTIALSFRLPQ